MQQGDKVVLKAGSRIEQLREAYPEERWPVVGEQGIVIATRELPEDNGPQALVKFGKDRVAVAQEHLEFCSVCAEPGMKPSHNGSPRCESGSIASGGRRSHCSCDVCF